MSGVSIEFVTVHEEFTIARATEGSAGYDMKWLDPNSSQEDITTLKQKVLAPGERHLFPLGCKLAIPQGWHIKVVPRSGLALKHGITVLNAPGIIDSDYRGEMGCLLVNTSIEPYTVKHGERICQILVERTFETTFCKVSTLSETNRGVGGFGSTGS